MKKLSYFLSLSALIMLFLATGCKDDEPDVDPAQEQLDKMNKNHKFTDVGDNGDEHVMEAMVR